MRARYQRHILKKVLITVTVIFLLGAIALGIYEIKYWNLFPSRSYTAEDFGIETIKSKTDKNNNGIDDYTDILLGARDYIATRPVYKSKYYNGGYPPAGEGVCTDVIWEAFKNAGYSLKDLIDADISKNPECYPDIKAQDKNIDFRRVRNLKVFFDRHAESLTINPDEIAQWQPGDIVVFSNHIAIISDKRDKKGRPYIIHNAGHPSYEEDALTWYKIAGHYRWVQ